MTINSKRRGKCNPASAPGGDKKATPLIPTGGVGDQVQQAQGRPQAGLRRVRQGQGLQRPWLSGQDEAWEGCVAPPSGSHQSDLTAEGFSGLESGGNPEGQQGNTCHLTKLFWHQFRVLHIP
jgi:hypothetical protein